MAALLIFFGCESLQNAVADGETRSISFHHMHTDETLTITYKVNGRYDDQALARIDQLLRDWRENQAIKMDPHLIDLLWEVQRETGSKEPIWVVCGYRSPATNSMLRRRSSGVAEFSQHTLGKAIDFYIPGVPLEQVRAAGLRAQRGGVGFYPTSGSPFVHLDTGSVRHWPRMPEAQLVAVLSKGPLGSRGASDKGTAVAQADSQGSSPASFFARFFGSATDTRATESNSAAQTPPKGDAPTRKITARLLPETRTEKTAAAADKNSVAANSKLVAASVSEVHSKSKPIRVAEATSVVTPAEMSANDVINARGYWQGLPSSEPAAAPRPGPARTASGSRRSPTVALASAEAETITVSPWASIVRSQTEAMPSALSYASEATPIATRATPIAAGVPRAAGAAVAAAPEATVSVNQNVDGPVTARARSTSVVRVGDQFNDPWMRAMIVSPSAQAFLRTSVYGETDFRTLRPQMEKPVETVTMTFSDDPHLGITTEKFAGSAVVFISTVNFTARTAALR
jgi:uncharacterized protein YcbK (DUF882 family)